MTTLLVTNDFPPAVGGIQSYLRDFLSTVDAREIIVFASTQDAAAAAVHDAASDYRIVRWPRSVMLPTPATTARMQELIRTHSINTVWFGAAAPLALMGAAAKRAGATRVIATTHGHEVGWSMLPGARQALARIGRSADIITYISEYTVRRIRGVVGDTPRYVHLPSGVDTDFFRPAAPQDIESTRRAWNVGRGPVIVCASRLVPRKGQDQLIRCMPDIVQQHPDAHLVIVGEGRYRRALERLATDVSDSVLFTGSVSSDDMRDLVAAADIVAMPARTRGGGLDVEGLGIVYLEAQACGVAVIAGNSGGAPETVTPETGIVVDGADTRSITHAIMSLIDDPVRRARMGKAGRDHVLRNWTWDAMGKRLNGLI
ncbi:glycosyltransferase family 4 protein [Corynebacterium cystitidis]|uniref:glycosyltransferase family 4 protein n=1 Tax=Corynebacterium cystitidis TaxID=35757 RepID=UPI00211E4B0E|nr:glycosyltransferase family 4 protein [Corynebacterium cystitidis]